MKLYKTDRVQQKDISMTQNSYKKIILAYGLLTLTFMSNIYAQNRTNGSILYRGSNRGTPIGTSKPRIPNSSNAYHYGNGPIVDPLKRNLQPKSNVDFQYNGINYRIISNKDMTVSITTTEIGQRGSTLPIPIIIPEYAYRKKKKYRVISIDSDAIKGYNPISSFTVYANMDSIDIHAFRSCSKNVKVLNLHCNFVGSWIKYLSSNLIEVGSEVSNVAQDAFDTSNNIAFHCAHIGNWFGKNRSLRSVTIGNEVKSIDKNAFSSCPLLSTVKFHCSIIENWFCRSNIKNVMFGEEVIEIGDNAFTECRELNLASPLANVKKIGNAAFNGCRNLTTIDISKVESIGINAFRDCTSLTSISIPQCMECIGNYAFYGCKNLLINVNGVHVIDMGVTTPTGETVYWSIGDLVQKGNSFNISSSNECGTEFRWGSLSVGTKENEITTSNIYGNPQYDIATAKLGHRFRLPTQYECEQLTKECDIYYHTTDFPIDMDALDKEGIPNFVQGQWMMMDYRTNVWVSMLIHGHVISIMAGMPNVYVPVAQGAFDYRNGVIHFGDKHFTIDRESRLLIDEKGNALRRVSGASMEYAVTSVTLTSKKNNNKLVIPYNSSKGKGHISSQWANYWIGSLYEKDKEMALSMMFNTEGMGVGAYTRDVECRVRPVCVFPQSLTGK
ncbi:MAG: leucine-rich repeat domain-containing protein [Bacteroidaceae bacterium]|nr:leucine-rich repeat domain-containing protein [Bacteroidaceae bacterium]